MKKKSQNIILISVFLVLVIASLIILNLPEKENSKTKIFCIEEQRNVDACIEIYQPVCGKVNVQCITEPCDSVFETFSNSCFACSNELVEYYTNGECTE